MTGSTGAVRLTRWMCDGGCLAQRVATIFRRWGLMSLAIAPSTCARRGADVCQFGAVVVR